MDAKKYRDYVEHGTPKHSCFRNMCKAFVSGGLLCVIGQGLTNIFMAQGMSMTMASAYTTLCLITGSVLLTGFNLVVPLVRFAGAGIWCQSPALPIRLLPVPSNTVRKG